MAPMSRIVELAAQIQNNVVKIDDGLKQNGLPDPSLSPEALQWNRKLPAELATAENAVLDAMDELQALIGGADGFFAQTGFAASIPRITLHTLCHFNIAKTFPINSTATVRDIASAAGMDETDARRILRHAVTLRIFKSPSKDTFEHTSISRTLAENPLLVNYLEMNFDWSHPSASYAAPAMAKWPGSQEPNETAYNLMWNRSEPYFEMISHQPSGSKRFSDLMTYISNRPGTEIEKLLDNYDWMAIASSGATVVDVGGAHGEVLLGLAKRYPGQIKCVVQDLPEVIANARTNYDHGELSFESHDMFTPQPLHGASLYILRQILHDWSDKYCIQILRNLIPALKPGAKLLINDRVVPDAGTLPIRKERSLVGYDLAMKQMFNSKEREEGEWIELLREADERFHVERIWTPKESIFSIIDVTWTGNEKEGS